MDENLTANERKLIVKLADASRKIEELEDYKRRNLVASIKRFGRKYSDEELEKMDLKSLEDVEDTCSRFTDESLYDIPPTKGGLPPIREEVKKYKRIDFSRVFEDVAKEFNMSHFETKSEK